MARLASALLSMTCFFTITTANVTLALLSVTPANQDIRLDVATGAVDILHRTQSGTYALVYQICEIAAPDNCAEGTASLNLSGK